MGFTKCNCPQAAQGYCLSGYAPQRAAAERAHAAYERAQRAGHPNATNNFRAERETAEAKEREPVPTHSDWWKNPEAIAKMRARSA